MTPAVKSVYLNLGDFNQAISSQHGKTNTQQSTPIIGRPTELISNGQLIRYTYDSHGRMLYKTKESVDNPDKHKRTVLHLQYNANNEVIKSLTREYQDKHITQTCTRYHYDAFGRRIAKHSDIRQLTKNGDTLEAIQKPTYQYTHMLWDGDKLIQEYSDNHIFTTVYDQSSFAPVARLVWLREGTINEHVSEQDKDWLTKFNAWESEQHLNPRDRPQLYDDYLKKDKLDDITSIKVYYYHNDQLGTPNELTNKTVKWFGWQTLRLGVMRLKKSTTFNVLVHLKYQLKSFNLSAVKVKALMLRQDCTITV